ncbi:MAG: hypothetical protein M1274_10330 [Actinobacteria bacterium]|nr:hypothetical protein [Actinomycetota bacterium]
MVTKTGSNRPHTPVLPISGREEPCFVAVPERENNSEYHGEAQELMSIVHAIVHVLGGDRRPEGD